MGADGYGKDAIACVDLAKEFVGQTGVERSVAVS
jgi:hypothetical protein